MLMNKDLRLREAIPKDIPHLLLWENPEQQELEKVAYWENADLVDYRENLLNRVDSNCRYLNLQRDYRWHQEIENLHQICQQTSKPVVLLIEFDCLVTYLRSKPDSQLSLFWKTLQTTRHLESRLWIVFPPSLSPPNWEAKRIQEIDPSMQFK